MSFLGPSPCLSSVTFDMWGHSTEKRVREVFVVVITLRRLFSPATPLWPQRKPLALKRPLPRIRESHMTFSALVSAVFGPRFGNWVGFNTPGHQLSNHIEI